MRRDRGPLSGAWVLKAEAAGERVTPIWAAVCAAVALAAFLVSTAFVLTDAMFWPGAGLVLLACSMFIGPLFLILAALALAFLSLRLSASAAMFTATAALPACGLSAIAAASWSAGFDAADANLLPGWFAAAAPVFFSAAWIAGTLCLVAPVSTLWRRPRTLCLRPLLSLLIAVPGALLLGVIFLSVGVVLPVAASALLFLALRFSVPAGGRAALPVPPVHTVLPAGRPTTAAGTSQRTRRVVALIAVVTLFLGLGCAGFALYGSTWTSAVRDTTHAMNLGLAAGALVAIPVTAAAGILLRPRVGRSIIWSALLFSGSLMLGAGAQLAGAGSPAQWPLSLAAGVLAGFAIALPFGRFVADPPALRFAVVLLAGFAASIVGLNIVAMAGFVAPLAAGGLLYWAAVRPRSPGTAVPAPV